MNPFRQLQDAVHRGLGLLRGDMPVSPPQPQPPLVGRPVPPPDFFDGQDMTRPVPLPGPNPPRMGHILPGPPVDWRRDIMPHLPGFPGPGFPRPIVDRPLPLPPAELRTPWVYTSLDFYDFVAGEAWRNNEWFTLARFTIPVETAFRIEADQAFRAYFHALATQAGANAAAAASRTIATPGIVDTPLGKNPLPARNNLEVQVWCLVGTVWSQADITAVNFAVGNVTYNEPVSCTQVECYYLHGDGEMRIRESRELGFSDAQATTLYNNSLSALHTVDQVSSDTSHKWPRTRTFLPGFQLSVDIRSARNHVVNPRSPHMLVLPMITAQLTVHDRARLRQIGEIDLREGV